MFMPTSFEPLAIARPHLVTIPYSHYCEFSRWALERAGIDFVEAQYIPGYHAKVVGQLRSNKADRSDSSYAGQESGVHGGRRKYAVPLLCLPGGRILRDSWDIAAYALDAIDDNWKTKLDQELGIAVRQLGYHYLLAPESRRLLNRMIASSSLYERGLWFLIKDKVISGMRQLLAITPENANQSKETILRIFDEVGDLLDEQSGTLTPESGLGAFDIAFCSLAAYCVMPKNFGNGAVKMPTAEDFPSEFQDFIHQCRSTKTGQYILRSYEQRHISAAS